MRILLASTCLLITSVSAYAADLVPADQPAVIAADAGAAATPVAERWGGVYAGGTVGYGFLKDTYPDKGKDWIYGGFAGYNFQMGHFVAGIEGSFDKTNIGFETLKTTSGDMIYAGKIRAGWGNDMMLVYGTLGIEHGITKGLPPGYTKDSALQLGAGVDFAVTDKISLGVNYSRAKYNDYAHLSNIFGRPIDVTTQKISARLTYTFN